MSKIQRSLKVKGNKIFVKSMIITAIIGLTTLLIVMFIGIKYFVKGHSVGVPQQSIQMAEGDNEFYITSVGIVKEISEGQIVFLDIEKKQILAHKIKPTTKILDAYENTIPLTEVKVGDLVDIVYQPEKENLVCIRFTAKAFKKTDMKNLKIDRSNRTLTIGGSVYSYTGNTLVLDEENNQINMHKVNDYDALELIGLGNHIYTIKVLERAGYLKIGELPSYEGMLEIDINRQIPLSENMPVISMSPGDHKVTLNIEGYEPVVTNIVIEANKTFTYTPEKVIRSETELRVQVVNAKDYEVKVGDTIYAKDESIKVPTGKYKVEITADGYRKWQQELSLEEPIIHLQVTLALIEAEDEPAATPETNLAPDTNSSEVVAYSINISSEPGDAKVYINGESKGNTPYKTKLPVGEYSITLKKEGYQDYETNILIDHSDEQNSYLYMLIPE